VNHWNFIVSIQCFDLLTKTKYFKMIADPDLILDLLKYIFLVISGRNRKLDACFDDTML